MNYSGRVLSDRFSDDFEWHIGHEVIFWSKEKPYESLLSLFLNSSNQKIYRREYLMSFR